MARTPRFRLITAAIAITAAAAALAGCGSSSGSSGSGGKTLTVWDPFSQYGAGTPEAEAAYLDLVKQLDQVFEQAHPGVTVKHAHYAYEGYDAKLSAAVAAGNAPDIAWEYGDLSWQLTDPLDSLLSPAQKADLTLLQQSVVSAADRKLHVLPVGTYQGVWMYNKKLFAKAGVSIPTTQAQWLDNCQKLNQAGIRPTQVSFGIGHKLDRYAALYAGQLIPDINQWNAGKIEYSSPQYTAGVQIVLDDLKAGCWGKSPASQGIAGDTDSTFLAGQAAMDFATSNIDVASIEAKIGKGNLGVFLQPTLPGGAGPSMDASLEAGLTLLKTSNNKDLAWQYMSLWASAKGEELAWQKVGQIPNNKQVKVTATDPVDSQLLAWATSGNPLFHVGAWPVNNTESTAYLQIAPSVVSGYTSVSSFLSRMQKVRQQASGS